MLSGTAKLLQAIIELKPPRVKTHLLFQQRDTSKSTPLHAAMISGNEALVLFLLKAFARSSRLVKFDGQIGTVPSYPPLEPDEEHPLHRDNSPASSATRPRARPSTRP